MTNQNTSYILFYMLQNFDHLRRELSLSTLTLSLYNFLPAPGEALPRVTPTLLHSPFLQTLVTLLSTFYGFAYLRHLSEGSSALLIIWDWLVSLSEYL